MVAPSRCVVLFVALAAFGCAAADEPRPGPSPKQTGDIDHLTRVLDAQIDAANEQIKAKKGKIDPDALGLRATARYFKGEYAAALDDVDLVIKEYPFKKSFRILKWKCRCLASVAEPAKHRTSADEESTWLKEKIVLHPSWVPAAGLLDAAARKKTLRLYAAAWAYAVSRDAELKKAAEAENRAAFVECCLLVAQEAQLEKEQLTAVREVLLEHRRTERATILEMLDVSKDSVKTTTKLLRELNAPLDFPAPKSRLEAEVNEGINQQFRMGYYVPYYTAKLKADREFIEWLNAILLAPDK